MKKFWTAALAVALLPACAPRAGAVTFLPVLSGPELSGTQTGSPSATLAPQPGGALLFAPSRLRLAYSAAIWDLPEVDIAAQTGVVGDQVKLKANVTSLVGLEYRVTPRLGIGGIFTPLTTDLDFEGPTADALRAKGLPGAGRMATVAMNLWEAHLTTHLAGNMALQAGVLRYRGGVTATVADPNGGANKRLRVGVGGTEMHLWGYKSWRIWGYTGRPAYFTGGLGLRQLVSSEDPSTGPKMAGQVSTAFTYFPRDNISLDVSLWAADVTDDEARSFRVNTGVTGHF